MPEFVKRRKPTETPRVVGAKPDKAAVRPATLENPLLARHQAMGNQEVQRMLHSGTIQANLTINPPDDKYEKEADRVAEQVFPMPEAGSQHPVEEEEKEKKILGREPPVRHPVTGERDGNIRAPFIVHDVLRSPGRPLDPGTRTFMESRFGHDFSEVRVHDDSRADESARSHHSMAYTVGRDILFSRGKYEPGIPAGRRLLAHELSHVIQQARGGSSNQPEQRANAAAESVVRGEAVSTALLGGVSRSVQMKPEPETGERGEGKSGIKPKAWLSVLDKFELNRWALKHEHHKRIEALAAEIAGRAGFTVGGKATISITGHTDTSGDEKYNEDLGLKRANSAKIALEAALTKEKVGGDAVSAVTIESAGEKRLARETADNIREPLNRRVEITVKIEGEPSSVSTAPATPSPYAEPPTRQKVIELNLPPDFKLPEESWWERTERERKLIEEYDRAHPRRGRSLTDVLVEGVTRALEPVIKKLPTGLRGKAREGIRKGIEAGTEKACEAAIDASGVTGKEAEALKACCKAALKTKYGEKR
jgi:outer membrane protein OmpA-like peptidoglycan-associated protein